ncbi:MAG: hypothetical protein M1830_006319, partial [Pleopsidium flavum]
DAQGFDFRLFSTPNTTRAPTKDDKATTQRIIIRSPTPSLNSTPGFLIPSRPKEYYFADSPSTTRRKEFEHVALTGEDVLKLARPGCTLPWRVLTLCLPPRPSLHPKPNPISPKEQTLHPPHSNPTLKKRPRPNKKRRLTIRQRHSTIAKEEVSKAEREVAEREKRTRKNRERKVKRKMKEKEKGKEGKKLTKEISDAKEFG